MFKLEVGKKMWTISSLMGFLSKSPHLAYVFLFLGSYFETLIGPSFFIIGDFFFLAGAILAGAGVLNIWLVSLVCISGGILGDSSSYYIGRKYGKKFFKRFFKKENKYFTIKNYNKGIKAFHTHGKKSIFFSRLLGPFLSKVTPFMAGALHVRYGTFLKYNIPGVVVGIGMFMVLGYLFGLSYSILAQKIKEKIFYLGLLLILIFIVLILKKLKVFNKIKKYFKS